MEKKASQEQRAGYSLKCPICGGENFWQHEALLSTRIMTLIKLDWVNPRADIYICDHCRHILWFFPEDEKL
jgi:cytochrome c-type biogenesis protein CcmH/NrfF